MLQRLCWYLTPQLTGADFGLLGKKSVAQLKHIVTERKTKVRVFLGLKCKTLDEILTEYHVPLRFKAVPLLYLLFGMKFPISWSWMQEWDTERLKLFTLG